MSKIRLSPHFIYFLGKKKKSLNEHVDFIEKENEIFANNFMPFYITESCTDIFYDDIWKYKHSGYLHLNKIGLFLVLYLLFVYDSISSSFLWVLMQPAHVYLETPSQREALNCQFLTHICCCLTSGHTSFS